MSAELAERNLLLRSISGEVRDLFVDGAKPVAHERGLTLQDVGGHIDDLVFPLRGLISLTVDTSEGRSVEVAVIGNEGFSGVNRYLGRATSDTNAVVQVHGEFLHVGFDAFNEAIQRDSKLKGHVNQLVRSLMVETAQSAVCNQVHSVEQRTARWLLHATDRAGTSDLLLTQEFLSQMLAVRRPGVTTVVGIFTRAGLIDTKRGLIIITDRDGLREFVCECYDVVRAATPVYD